MNRRWIVDLMHGSRLEKRWVFMTENEALDFYIRKMMAVKLGLVGFLVTYPCLETDNIGAPT